jgi:ABC-type lipoprotein export system ATPase subunit
MSRTLTCTVEKDAVVSSICSMFDYAFNGTSTFIVDDVHAPIDWSIGVIVGPSGSGKSSILRSFGIERDVEWSTSKAIVSHFKDADDAQERLGAVGLNSVPDWMRPYNVLSTGQKFRADLARRLDHGSVIDEFTSVVDRVVAMSASVAMRRYVDKTNLKRIVIATCHRDVIQWLEPDWVYDTEDHRMVVGRSKRPRFNVELVRCSSGEWTRFSHHHYLDGALNRSARCWIAEMNGTKVGFVSALAFPNGAMKNAWREHRTVVIPDYQGLGIGPKISDAVASMFINDGCRYFSKTSHPRLGMYRERSPLWRATSKNRRSRKDYRDDYITKEDGHKMAHAHRVCFSHEYIGRTQ